jgi:hypothetical protein
MFTFSFRLGLFSWYTRVFNLTLPTWVVVAAGAITWYLIGDRYV